MQSKYFLYHISVFSVIAILQASTALAGDAAGKSGLDLDRGYDVNTVAMVTGKVSTPPYSGDREITFVDISNSSEKLHLAVGPSSYWEKHGIKLALNDEVYARGSKTQGRDGAIYMLVRKLENRTTGSQIELRTEQGEAVWNGAKIQPSIKERFPGGQMNRGGGMMNRGGGMNRSGGMMRH